MNDFCVALIFSGAVVSVAICIVSRCKTDDKNSKLEDDADCEAPTMHRIPWQHGDLRQRPAAHSDATDLPRPNQKLYMGLNPYHNAEKNVLLESNNKSSHRNRYIQDLNSDILNSVSGIWASEPLVKVKHVVLIEETCGDSTHEYQDRCTPDLHSSSIRDVVSPFAHSADQTLGVLQLYDQASVDVNLPSILLSDLSLEHVLGGGSFGQVWKGSWRGTPVAVKVLSPVCQASLPEKLSVAFNDEVAMLARLRHPNICLFMGACLAPPNRAIVTEFVARGSLWDVLRTPNLFSGFSGPLHWPAWASRRVLDSCLRGILYLHKHEPPIIHRDLKSANLLIDESFNVKICDFGLARLRDFSTQMTANVGTAQWMAPEVLNGQPYTESVDMFSYGVIVWEILTGTCPFESLSPLEIAIAVSQRGARPPIPAAATERQQWYIESCWATESSHRFTAEMALRELESTFPQ